MLTNCLKLKLLEKAVVFNCCPTCCDQKPSARQDLNPHLMWPGGNARRHYTTDAVSSNATSTYQHSPVHRGEPAVVEPIKLKVLIDINQFKLIFSIHLNHFCEEKDFSKANAHGLFYYAREYKKPIY